MELLPLLVLIYHGKQYRVQSVVDLCTMHYVPSGDLPKGKKIKVVVAGSRVSVGLKVSQHTSTGPNVAQASPKGKLLDCIVFYDTQQWSRRNNTPQKLR